MQSHDASRGARRSMMSSAHSVASEPVQRVFKVLESAEEHAVAKASAANASCFVYVAPAVCAPTAATVTFAQELSDKGDADNIDFYICDVNNAVGAAAAKADLVGALPTFVFYFAGQKLEEFSGDNLDKFKVSCKATIGKRLQIQKQEKDDAEAAAKAAAATA